MGKLLFHHLQFTKLEVEKLKVPLRVTNSIGKLLFFNSRVTNSKSENKKFYFELLIRKIKNQNLDFEVTRNNLINFITSGL